MDGPRWRARCSIVPTKHMTMPTILVLVVLALAYVRGWFRQSRTSGEAIGAARGAGFLLGLTSIGIAVASPLASGDAHLLTIHMVQHLLLMSVAPPLFWLGEPARLFLQGSRWRSLPRLATPLSYPVVCWVAATGVLVAWHVPAALAQSLHSPAWHAIEHASFLAGGLLFWWPVVRPW